MTKEKKHSQQEEAMDRSTTNVDENGGENSSITYEEKFKYMNAMASPVAPKKLAKKIFKCIKQGTKQKNYIRLGLRETQKYIRRGEKGLVVLERVNCGNEVARGIGLQEEPARASVQHGANPLAGFPDASLQLLHQIGSCPPNGLHHARRPYQKSTFLLTF